MSDPRKLADELRVLLAHARMGEVFYAPGIPEEAVQRVTGSVWHRRGDVAQIVGFKPHYVDADLIVWLINNAPELLSALDALAELRRRWDALVVAADPSVMENR